jgi:hypothetical protein
MVEGVVQQEPLSMMAVVLVVLVMLLEVA